MSKVCESYLDFMAPLETTSIALNGLLKVDGPLTAVRENYSLDIKRDIQKKKDEELGILYSQVLANAKNAQFRLVRVNDGVTRLYYRLEKRSYTVLLILMIIFQIFFSVIFSLALYSVVGSSERIALIVGGLVFVLCMILFSCMPYFALRQSNDNRIMRNMNKYFAERVNAYIAIARKYQANRQF